MRTVASSCEKAAGVARSHPARREETNGMKRIAGLALACVSGSQGSPGGTPPVMQLSSNGGRGNGAFGPPGGRAAHGCYQSPIIGWAHRRYAPGHRKNTRKVWKEDAHHERSAS